MRCRVVTCTHCRSRDRQLHVDREGANPPYSRWLKTLTGTQHHPIQHLPPCPVCARSPTARPPTVILTLDPTGAPPTRAPTV